MLILARAGYKCSRHRSLSERGISSSWAALEQFIFSLLVHQLNNILLCPGKSLVLENLHGGEASSDLEQGLGTSLGCSDARKALCSPWGAPRSQPAPRGLFLLMQPLKSGLEAAWDNAVMAEL